VSLADLHIGSLLVQYVSSLLSLGPYETCLKLFPTALRLFYIGREKPHANSPGLSCRDSCKMPTKAPYRRSLYLTVLEVICVELGRSIPSFDAMGFSKSSHVRARHVPLVNFISLSNHIVMFVVLLVLLKPQGLCSTSR
jgi:hypothetical protein